MELKFSKFCLLFGYLHFIQKSAISKMMGYPFFKLCGLIYLVCTRKMWVKQKVFTCIKREGFRCIQVCTMNEKLIGLSMYSVVLLFARRFHLCHTIEVVSTHH